VDWLIVIAGAVGIAVAAFGFVSLTRDAVHRRQYIDIAVAVAAAAAVVLLLLAYGDTFLR